MTIPKNITSEHIVQAINKIEGEGVPSDGGSQYYDLLYQGKRYPPKLVVSYANLFANGSILPRSDFEGGPGKPAFKLLEARGFEIVPKDNSIYPLVINFLKQSTNNPNSLATRDFPGEYQDLKLKVSFGQGAPAATPWIAMLGGNQSVSEGIYPVFLYYKQHKLLILSYGLSETHKSQLAWKTRNLTIRDYFAKTLNVEPNRYGDSFVFAAYEIDSSKDNYGLSSDTVDGDVEKIIAEYKDLLSTLTAPAITTPPQPVRASAAFDASNFVSDLRSAHLIFNENLVCRFIAALATKPFVLLTGLSGSGKTKLALAFAQWVIKDESQLCIAAVGADWTNREPLLGFPNMQKEGLYVKPENKILDLILRANSTPDLPFFLILDEMNLSHVERYFADFLSAMESKQSIGLHTSDSPLNNGEVSRSLNLPNNLFIIGTVNVDETTYMFSPKVLDRASVIEFRVTSNEMRMFLTHDRSALPSSINGNGASMAESFLKICFASGYDVTNDNAEQLIQFFISLKKAGAEFGYRTASEIHRFISVAPRIKAWDQHAIFDFVIIQKLLPKVHGSRRKLEPILKTLAGLCLSQPEKIAELLKAEVDETNSVHTSAIKYPLSFDKIKRMYQNLIDNSFTSYAEA
jgi:5-methylcytosine-specific restriction protein B